MRCAPPILDLIHPCDCGMFPARAGIPECSREPAPVSSMANTNNSAKPYVIMMIFQAILTRKRKVPMIIPRMTRAT